MPKIILIAHNLRSCHNVGSLLRTAEGLGVEVILSGYTPYPVHKEDTRLPHISAKLTKQIQKTALGAETSVVWSHYATIEDALIRVRQDGFHVVAIEQATHSISLPKYTAPEKIALLVGREVEGIELEVLNMCDDVLEIPMYGQKESFNVTQAAAMAMYHCRFLE